MSGRQLAVTLLLGINLYVIMRLWNRRRGSCNVTVIYVFKTGRFVEDYFKIASLECIMDLVTKLWNKNI